MKSVGEVKQKLKQAKFRHVKKRILAKFGKDKVSHEEIELFKRQLYAIFDSPPHIVAQEFPDVAALMWVLEEESDADLMVEATLVGTLDGVMLWADSEDKAAHARQLLDSLAQGPGSPPKKAWWRLFT